MQGLLPSKQVKQSWSNIKGMFRSKPTQTRAASSLGSSPCSSPPTPHPRLRRVRQHAVALQDEARHPPPPTCVRERKRETESEREKREKVCVRERGRQVGSTFFYKWNADWTATRMSRRPKPPRIRSRGVIRPVYTVGG